MNQSPNKEKPTVLSKTKENDYGDTPHKGHRERLRKKWKNGVVLEKHELLELLLFYPIPRRNTNEIAHALLDRFGSLQEMLDASDDALMKIQGVGAETVTFLKMLAELIARYQEEQINKNLIFHSFSELCAYLTTLFIGQSKEQVYLLLFNSSGRLILTEKIGDGFATMSEISMKRINQLAVCFGASSAVLSHNHPSGLTEPSVQDVETTKRVQAALDLLGVTLADHVIVSRGSCVSMMHGHEKYDI